MKHLPWILLALVLAYPLLAQGTLTKQSSLRGPVKVFGIPHPDEWIDIESNVVGQPAATYTVPDGHRLTLVGVFKTPPHDGAMNGSILVNGSVIGVVAIQAGAGNSVGGQERMLTRLNGSGYAGAADLPRHSFVRGTVVGAGDVVTVEHLTGTDPETFTLRGFLEKVE